MSTSPNDSLPRLSRAGFFREVGRGVASLLAELFDDSLDLIEKAFPEVIRPPGAALEGMLIERCIRCGACRRSCPFRAIRPVTRPGSLDEGTPQIVPTEGWCRVCPDFPCARSCRTGALACPSLTPDSPPTWAIGLAEVVPGACLRISGASCTACLTACPARFRAVNLPDPAHPPRIEATVCTGCGACVAACPARPVRAVRIAPRLR